MKKSKTNSMFNTVSGFNTASGSRQRNRNSLSQTANRYPECPEYDRMKSQQMSRTRVQNFFVADQQP